MIYLTLIALATACGFRFLRRRQLFDPVFLLTGVWTVVLGAHSIWQAIQPAFITPLSTETLVLLALALIFFSAGDWWADRVAPALWAATSSDTSEPAPTPPILDRLLFWVPIASAPFFVTEAIRLVAEGPLGSFPRVLRWQLTLGGETYGLLAYLVPLTVFACWRQLELMPPRPDIRAGLRFSAVLVPTLVVHVLMSGRTYLALLLTVLVCSRSLARRPVRRLILVAGLLFLGVFVAFAVLMVKGGSPHATLTENLGSVSTNAAQYVVGGLRGFDATLTRDFELPGGGSTRFARAVSYRLGLSSHPPQSLIQPEIAVPFTVNVYTLFGTIVPDFGRLGGSLWVLWLGALHGLSFRRALDGHRGARYATALLTYPLLMWFFQDQYLSLTSTWLQYLAIYLLFFRVAPLLVRFASERLRDGDSA